ncbi:hypothetical protein AVEN_178176-1 [Araneus ventricosus]|uniref:Uncharacterized protein n=1 Tax=Araneus ventricosus TaxID=182803 RepID=A0A4Y2HUG0_ARAVE|nr:hypothetical protein AVEN_178176-1 [Araneus ventricosus]
MRTRLPVTATVCDRCNVSDKTAVARTSAVLKDFGVISEVDTSHVVDKNKVRREKSLKRSELQLHRNKKWHATRVERRRFVDPKLNFKANQYIGMIDWFKCDVITEPPIAADHTVEELKSIAEDGFIKDLQIYKFPCQAQSVERCVKLMTEAASTVGGSHNRNGFIRNVMASRAIMPSFEH